MNILITKKNDLYNVTVDNNAVKDTYIYRLYPIKFVITQYNIDFFLSNFCNVTNCYIKDCDVEQVVKRLEDFILLQDNLFLLNQEGEHGILEEILTILNSSKKILTPIPTQDSFLDIKTEFNDFLNKNIILFKDNTSTVTSTEIKRKFFKSLDIEQRWHDDNFKKINNEVNNLLNSWERENNIASSISRGVRYCFKTFYGIGLKN